MRVLVACEFSGIVREAFTRKGADAWSIDLLPSEIPGNHVQDDVLKHLNNGWKMMIAFPPCTYLCSSGARWWKGREKQQATAINFIQQLLNAPIDKIALENPVGCISTLIRKPDQYIQPWMFGHGETKKTGLWLKNLPTLKPTNIVNGRFPRVWLETLRRDRWKNRSRTYQGIADAMAEQWL